MESVFEDDAFDTAVRVAGGAVYLGSLSETVYKLDLTQGDVLWKYKTVGSIVTVLTVVDGMLLFVNPGGGQIWIFDADSGSVLWHGFPPEYRTDRYATYLAPLAANDEYIVAIGSKKIYGLKLYSD